MISSEDLVRALSESGLVFSCGVPDSLMKPMLSTFASQSLFDHVVSANEGAAVGHAIGNYLITGKVPLVYLQNSGIGNCVNPLVSLCDPQVYDIPLFLVVGWRGETLSDGNQIKDEPQHIKQGQITLELLDCLGIQTHVIGPDTPDALARFVDAYRIACDKKRTVAVVVRKGTFAKSHIELETEAKLECNAPFYREDAIRLFIEKLGSDHLFVSTTGYTSREVYSQRKALHGSVGCDFLTVGGMGHALAIACGIAGANSNIKTICLDGDGAALMHMGTMAVASQLSNLTHVLFNNGVHDSVGSQRHAGANVNFTEISRAASYRNCLAVRTAPELIEALENISVLKGSTFIEVFVKPGARIDLERPSTSPVQNKIEFQRYLKCKNFLADSK